MKCPFCGGTDSKVVDSRSTEDGERIRRRRECFSCLQRFTTYETVESTPIIVIKRDSSREPFSREKLMNGLMRACEKRPVSITELEHIIDMVESRIYHGSEREISSKLVGEYTLDFLRELDEVAYVRFASVYKKFSDIQSFVDELEGLRNSIHKD